MESLFDYYNEKQMKGLITNTDLLARINKNKIEYIHSKSDCNSYKFDLITKTDEKGYYSFNAGYYYFHFYIRVEKNGLSTRGRFSDLNELTNYSNFGSSEQMKNNPYVHDGYEYLP